MSFELGEGILEAVDAIDQDRTISLEMAGVPGASRTIATFVPMASMAKPGSPPRTSTK
jgi:hypothetical protein